MANKKIPITLLCGYLGAGKTTLLNRVLTNQKGYKVAVIVNDIGEVNVDERLISKEAKIEDSSSLVPLTNGCICCTLKTDMENQIEHLMKTGKFDYIMIEASGVCEPMPIAQAIETIEIGKLDNVVGVVDASRLVEEFDEGKALLKEGIDEEDIESLLIQQIEFCSTLIINKRDLVTDEQMKMVRAVINKIQPSVKVFETTKCEVPVEEIIGTDRFDFETVYASAGWVKALEEHDAHEEDDDDDDHDEHEHHHDHDEHEHEHHHLFTTAAVHSIAKSLTAMQATGQETSSVQRVLYGSAMKTTWHMFLKQAVVRFRPDTLETGLLPALLQNKSAYSPKNQK